MEKESNRTRKILVAAAIACGLAGSYVNLLPLLLLGSNPSFLQQREQQKGVSFLSSFP